MRECVKGLYNHTQEELEALTLRKLLSLIECKSIKKYNEFKIKLKDEGYII